MQTPNTRNIGLRGSLERPSKRGCRQWRKFQLNAVQVSLPLLWMSFKDEEILNVLGRHPRELDHDIPGQF